MGMDWSGFGDRISRRVEQATERAQRKIEAASRKVNKRLATPNAADVAKLFGDRALELEFIFERRADSPKSPQASDEERLAILKMLQEKKITAEEAEKLLSALEGGS
jgi:hypothetical protein